MLPCPHSFLKYISMRAKTKQGNMSKIKIRYLNKGGGGIEGLRAFIEPVPYLMVQDSGVPSSLPPQGGHFQMIQLKVGPNLAFRLARQLDRNPLNLSMLGTLTCTLLKLN